MLHSQVLANGSIAQDRIRLMPTTPDISEGRWVAADPPAHDPDTMRADPITPVASDATQISYTLTTIAGPIPRIVSRFQARVALHNAGLLTTIEAIMSDPQTPLITRMAWADARDFERAADTVADLAMALSLTSEQIDDLFRAANQVRA